MTVIAARHFIAYSGRLTILLVFKHKVNVSITVCLQDAAPPEEQEEARKWLTWRMWCFLAAFSCHVISFFMSAYLLTVNQDKTQLEQKGDIFQSRC